MIFPKYAYSLKEILGGFKFVRYSHIQMSAAMHDLVSQIKVRILFFISEGYMIQLFNTALIDIDCQEAMNNFRPTNCMNNV